MELRILNPKYLSAALIDLALITALATGTAHAQSPNVQTVDIRNITRNGAVASAPLFVAARDVIEFDAALTTNGSGTGSTGLGLCLEYNRAITGDPLIGNVFNNGTLFAQGSSDPFFPKQQCLGNGSVAVSGADYVLVEGWASLQGTFPNVPLPAKLYDAQFTVVRTPAGSSAVGFGASSTATGANFATNGPLTLCGKPVVTVNALTNGVEAGSVSATIAIALSSPVPVACGSNGGFAVTLTLSGTATVPGQPNADYTIGGSQISANGATVTATFPADGSVASLTFIAKPVIDNITEGTETITLTVAPGTGNYLGVGGSATASISDTAQATATVVEFLDTQDFPGSPGGHFFYSSDPAEQAAVDAGAAGKFFRTNRTFKTGGSTPVCRFYGSIAPGPNSHFFTVNADECNQLKSLQKTPVPANLQQWNYERIEYNTTPPVAVNGALACPAGTSPLYRAYNNAFSPTGVKNPWDSNHRFTPALADIAAMVAVGWRDEGLQFCTAL